MSTSYPVRKGLGDLDSRGLQREGVSGSHERGCISRERGRINMVKW
jgi:hypothetical protein